MGRVWLPWDIFSRRAANGILLPIEKRTWFLMVLLEGCLLLSTAMAGGGGGGAD